MTDKITRSQWNSIQDGGQCKISINKKGEGLVQALDDFFSGNSTNDITLSDNEAGVFVNTNENGKPDTKNMYNELVQIHKERGDNRNINRVRLGESIYYTKEELTRLAEAGGYKISGKPVQGNSDTLRVADTVAHNADQLAAETPSVVGNEPAPTDPNTETVTTTNIPAARISDLNTKGVSVVNTPNPFDTKVPDIHVDIPTVEATTPKTADSPKEVSEDTAEPVVTPSVFESYKNVDVSTMTQEEFYKIQREVTSSDEYKNSSPDSEEKQAFDTWAITAEQRFNPEDTTSDGIPKAYMRRERMRGLTDEQIIENYKRDYAEIATEIHKPKPAVDPDPKYDAPLTDKPMDSVPVIEMKRNPIEESEPPAVLTQAQPAAVEKPVVTEKVKPEQPTPATKKEEPVSNNDPFKGMSATQVGQIYNDATLQVAKEHPELFAAAFGNGTVPVEDATKTQIKPTPSAVTEPTPATEPSVAEKEVKTELKPADTPPTTAALREESAKLNARIKELTSDQRDKKGKIIKYGYQIERENVETLRPIYARKAQIDRQLALVDAQEIPENKWIGKGFGASFVYKDNPKDGEDPYMISSYGTGVILQDGSRAIKVTLGSKVTYHKIESGQRYFPNDMYMGTLRKPEIMLYPGEEIPGAVERQ